jgi:SNF2 family DNA or RNA helicase
MDIQAIKLFVLGNIGEDELAYGEYIFNNGDCTILSQSAISVDFMIRINGGETFKEYVFILDEEQIVPECENERMGWNRYSYACLLQYEHELNLLEPGEQLDHKKYSRQGMMQRVLAERRQKAEKAKYHIKWAANIYGDHVLTNEKGIRYNVFLRDFENETGYSNSMDAALNKLGTTKHIMYAFRELKENKSLYDSLSHEYPFTEIFCDPLNDYKISLYYPGELPEDEKLLISRYFGKSNFIEDDNATSLLGFIKEAPEYPHICVRPEVKEKIERLFEQKMLKDLSKKRTFDFSAVKAELLPYQKSGVKFVMFRKAAIIADEMGLGKTLQAITAALLKKELFGFKKTLIVCPATLKSQWQKEIEKFTSEKAHIISGTPQERKRQYLSEHSFFHIVNYEMVLRDSLIINKAGIDYLILDEAQKIKNYETKTSAAIRRLKPIHTLIITGTPIENRLIDIYAIMSVIDPYFFGPLWEFSYQHCLFDPERPDKINGYYNLQQLNRKLSEILIRREKRTVINQLPNVRQINIPVELSPLQDDLHGSFAAGIARIISKKFLTPFDLQRLQQLLTGMRMVCDSTYLIDDTTNESPKMEILKEILFEKIDLHHSDRKIIIFSEWVKVHKLIGQMLRENKTGFVELTGKVPVALRGELIKKFESRPECKIFLSTEAGGTGLNLQVADILINFELPWNPAKKNQRIGRIDRLGQKSEKLTIYNFVTRNSIEQHIAAGLLVKQDLFDGVLDSDSTTNYVDFSSKGRSQFIKQLEAFLDRKTLDEEPAEETVGSSAETDSNDLSQIELIEDLNNDDTKPEEDLTETVRRETIQDEDKTSLPKDEPSGAGTDADSKAAEMEQVMNNGMQFLAGLFKMSTGKDMGLENQKIEIDKETGEVVMRFKMKF